MTTNADRDLAAAARRVNRAIRITAVDDATMRDAEQALLDAAKLLEASTHPGPHCQVGHEMTREPGTPFDPTLQPVDYFPYSPVIGPLNPLAPPVTLHVDDDKVVHGTVTLTEPYNGPPWNLAHGGVIAQIFDELLGVAGIVGAGGGFTGRLTVHYHRPTPILEELTLRAWLDEVRGRKLIARGEICHDGVMTTTAEGLFVKVGGALKEHDATRGLVDSPESPPPP